MMAPLLSPAPLQGRMSQLLPTVKCSNCSHPVPLNELSDHVCTPVPTLPKPTVTPAAAASLLPQHLQDRLPPNDRLRINTTSNPSSPRINPSSPLNSTARLSPSPSPSTSPLRTRQAAPPPDFRPRRPSNASYAGPSSPHTARPSFSSSRDIPSPYAIRPPPPLQHPPSSQHPPPPQSNPRSSPIPEPDTKIGGAAGMAGVGRRGFAAAARAAMFALPTDRPMGPQPRRDNVNVNAAPFLNTNIPRPTNETPPLSAGSANSSLSPGVSPYPQSPVGFQGPPSPRYDQIHKVPPPPSPIPLRPQLPSALIPGSPTIPKPIDTPSTAKQQPPPPPSPSPAHRPSESQSTTFSLYSQGASSAVRSNSNSSSSTNIFSRFPPITRPLSPTTDKSESESEYGGLAYADSTDNEDNDEPSKNPTTKGKANPPPPLPLTAGATTATTPASILLRSGSTASTGSNHVRFPSTSTSMRTHERKGSVSSVSSTGTGGESRKSNSAAIAQALGLSQAAPGAYGRLGGPGAAMGGRGGRSGSTSGSSSGSRSGHSRGAGSLGTGAMEKELKMLLENRAKEGEGEDRRAGLVKSKSTGKQRTFGVGEGEAGGVSVRAPLSAKNPSVSSVSRSERKLDVAANASVARAKSTSASENSSTGANSTTGAGTGTGKEKKERVKKPKVCLKCDKKIEDGRWVAVDNGGVLCEKCWKHMYLPKCRRCNLPIEKAAVSSADGQLKGKYHRECFNCHTCHKPFPDKTFYVFDGKPLCAYHYHEANESLCAAARCGQPIEGPCAVSHVGDRYHPEHMLCEYPGADRCAVRLDEYWEVEGRMLCERHSRMGGSEEGENGEGDGEEWVQSSKGMRRVTRFIELAGGLSSGGLR